METKNEIRKAVRSFRKAVTSEEKARWDQFLKNRLFTLEDMKRPVSVFCYLDVRNEAGTRMILEELWKRNIPAAVPKVFGAEMEFFYIRDFSETRPSAMGILEPEPELLEPCRIIPARPHHGSVIIVPGVAFAPNGVRIGYGGGYYDKYLNRFSDVMWKKIGLSYEFQLFDSLPQEPHDCLLDQIVTPTQTIVCRRNEYDSN